MTMLGAANVFPELGGMCLIDVTGIRSELDEGEESVLSLLRSGARVAQACRLGVLVPIIVDPPDDCRIMAQQVEQLSRNRDKQRSTATRFFRSEGRKQLIVGFGYLGEKSVPENRGLSFRLPPGGYALQILWRTTQDELGYEINFEFGPQETSANSLEHGPVRIISSCGRVMP
jgi:hypothetical protein